MPSRIWKRFFSQEKNGFEESAGRGGFGVKRGITQEARLAVYGQNSLIPRTFVLNTISVVASAMPAPRSALSAGCEDSLPDAQVTLTLSY